ncbi:energy transducer TonB [Entomohabitans teleogrylli]|uniref:energy transducer TonB n=1 Tax=Entomohabitans teleogrylli TaxID=1384589 RepID=UPI00073D1B39|nr:energy transducer TonB [Entomohabitans teleogrylli]
MTDNTLPIVLSFSVILLPLGWIYIKAPHLRVALTVGLAIVALVMPASVIGIWKGLMLATGMLWPSALNFQQRNFFSGLWLSGLLFCAALGYVAAAARRPAYGAAAGLSLVAMAFLSSLNMPISEQESRRRLAQNQFAASPEWKKYRADSAALFSSLVSSSRFPPLFSSSPPPALRESFQVFFWFGDYYQLLKLSREFHAAFVPHAIAADVENTEQIWRQALRNAPVVDPRAEAQAARALQDAAVWMADRGDVRFAAALFALISADPEQWRAGTLVDGFARAAQLNPENHAAWLGWALASTLSVQQQLNTSKIDDPIRQIIQALMIAEKWPDTPSSPLQLRLQQFIEQLPRVPRENFAILRARARVQLDRLENRLSRPEVVAQANRVLLLNPVVNAAESAATKYRKYSRDDQGIGLAEWPGREQPLTTIPWPYSAPETSARQWHSVLVSVDVSASGDPVAAAIEHSSGVVAFERQALESAWGHRYPTRSQGQRYLLPALFISLPGSPGADSGFNDSKLWAERLARRAARRDLAGARALGNVLRLLASRATRGNNQQSAFSSELWQWEKQRLALSLGATSISSDVERAQISLKTLEPLFTRYPGQARLYQIRAELYKDLWRGKNDPEALRQAREDDWRALVLDCDNPRHWMERGVEWIDSDPELAVGALVYARHLQMAKGDKGPGVLAVTEVGIRDRLLHAKPRGPVLLARLRHDFPEILGTGEPGKSQPALSQPLPLLPSQQPRQAAYYWPDARGQVVVDWQQAGITTPHLPVFPRTMPDIVGSGSKTVTLRIDVDRHGAPYLVMVARSSGVREYDEVAQAQAWRWRFTPQASERPVDVPVSFRWPVRAAQ